MKKSRLVVEYNNVSGQEKFNFNCILICNRDFAKKRAGWRLMPLKSSEIKERKKTDWKWVSQGEQKWKKERPVSNKI